MKEPPLFELRLRLYKREHDPRLVVIRAWDLNNPDAHGRGQITIQVVHGRKVIFAPGQLFGRAHGNLTGRDGKVLALNLATNDCGTPEQRAWVREHGDYIDLMCEERYEPEKPLRRNGWLPRRIGAGTVAHLVATWRGSSGWETRCDPSVVQVGRERLHRAKRVTCMACIATAS